MSKVKVKVVIGSNYGDEGKGLATKYFSESADNKMCLNVLFNGGSQRGHTVDLKNGKKHVFHHFGSGTYSDAHTYFDQNFMVNPMTFIKEYEDLKEHGTTPKCFVSPDCRVITPYDIFINQIVEKERDAGKHGSCGCGIWETQKRYEDDESSVRYNQLVGMTDKEVSDYLYDISHKYMPKRLSSYGIHTIPKEYARLVDSEGLIKHYLSDLREMQRNTTTINFDNIKNQYEVIVFEAGQGLELSESNTEAYPNVTASDTTSIIPVQRVKDLDCDIEICYVTRSYFTRHGAGKFPTECNKETINKNIKDNTNIPNEYQGSLRFGLFDKNAFLNRVDNDIKRATQISNRINKSVLITHLNYTNGDIAGNCTIKELSEHFNATYLSYSKYSEDIAATIFR